MMFTRTSSGKINKFLFYDEILIWVEGQDDYPFYERILRNRPCRLEVAYGKNECEKLAQAIIESNYPYIVIMDGDYEILERKRNPHRRIIYLQRYSIENYLFEEEPLNKVCRNYARVNDDEDVLGNTFTNTITNIENELFDLLVLDIAHYRENTGQDVFPNSVDAILENVRELTFDSIRISATCASNQTNEDSITEVEELITRYTNQRRLVDIIKGHIIFGIIRHLIFNSIRRIRNRPPYIDDDGLLNLLSSEAWDNQASPDHVRLKNKLYRAFRDAYTFKTQPK